MHYNEMILNYIEFTKVNYIREAIFSNRSEFTMKEFNGLLFLKKARIFGLSIALPTIGK